MRAGDQHPHGVTRLRPSHQPVEHLSDQRRQRGAAGRLSVLIGGGQQLGTDEARLRARFGAGDGIEGDRSGGDGSGGDGT